MPASRLLNRRSVLKSAAATVAAPYFVPASVFGATAPSNRITMGFVGTGNQGMYNLKRFLRKKDCQVLAVSDVNQGSLGYKNDKDFLGREPAQKMVHKHYSRETGQDYQGCDAYADFREILNRKDIQAVVLTTPDHWHAWMTIAAAKAGKDIYCEKPLSLTINQGKEMVRAVRENKRILQTGSHERSNPGSVHACELVRNGYIGDVKSILTHVGVNNKVGPGPGWKSMPVPEGLDYPMWLGPAPDEPYHADRCLYRFRFMYDYSGGQVTNYGAHSLDMAQWGLGMDGSGPVEVEYVDAKYLPKGSLFTTATHTHFRCRYASGVELTCKTAHPAVWTEFVGTEGTISIGAGRNGVKFSKRSLKDLPLRPEQMLHPSTDHLQDFLDSVKSRQDPAAPVEVGHRSATVCHLGNIAIKLKATLKWDPKAEQFVGNDQANALMDRPVRNDWAQA